MKLANRISLFFLAALAIVLVGFSASIYWLSRHHLFSQFEARSADALETLAAAIESSPRGLEWEVSERNINLGLGNSASIVWAVHDGQGKRIDGSAGGSELLEKAFQTRSDAELSTNDLRSNNDLWRVWHRRVRAPVTSSAESNESPSTTADTDVRHYPELTLSVGSSVSPILAQLRSVEFVLLGLSLGIWLLAAFVGRWICRRALLPLTNMSGKIATISVANFDSRLPPIATEDELAELAAAFNSLLDRLQVSFDRQRRFAAEASHQLRTPLTALQGQVEVALRRERSADDYRSALRSVEDQTANLRKIVESLLVLTREPIDRCDSDLECFDLNTWLNAHVGSWHLQPRIQDLRMEPAGTTDLWVTAHRGLLGQVVDNLWDNACKYSETGTPITFRASRTPTDIKLTVEDGGIGIAKEEIPRIADPFYRSDDARSRGIAGTGLGLAIVNRIVHAFGASMFIDSVLGKGSTFTVVFPATNPSGGNILAV